ncbi:hypothetical protein HS041_32570 [Planomonospora sp. ID67723]|uniref:hypothetical protein n=1 Tax=Planomonospora sp. ID67723 TaxID=2738134 RepID=UPI0018C3A5F8|nr:hypothetical protein [Planomonospora sp. ID67723]MBG0832442.1 hypothetical protein [Planomonospora sp. ID67723]
MGRMGKLGLGIGGCGAALLVAGITGMSMWPSPVWAVPAFASGMIVMFAGSFAAAWALHASTLSRTMSFFGGFAEAVYAGQSFTVARDTAPGAGYGRTMAGEHLSAADLLARGVPGTALVLGTFGMDGMTADNGDPIVGFVLLVTPADGRLPYEVRLGHRVPAAHLHRTLPGTGLPVKIAAEDPEKVAVDWDA